LSQGRRLDTATIVFAVLALAAGITVWYGLGPAAFRTALTDSLVLLGRIAPIIALALAIGGYITALVPEDAIGRWLGEDSGLRGQLLATAAGALTPGGPFTAFPMVLALYRTGAAWEVSVAYITSWSVLGVNRVLIWEIPLLGWDFVLLRLAASLPLPLLAGYSARALRRARWLPKAKG